MHRPFDIDGVSQIRSGLGRIRPNKTVGNSFVEVKYAKFRLGAIVQHRLYSFRGIIFDVDFEFSNSEEWYLSIPEEARPRRNQPYYHLYAQNEQTTYEAYVSEQNLLLDDSGEPLRHPSIELEFKQDELGAYFLRFPPHH